MKLKGYPRGHVVLIWACLLGGALPYSSGETDHRPPKTESRKDSKDQRRPNVVLFMADDLGIGDVGCFGNDTIRTPNLDQLASEGVKLTHHLTAAPVCTPSRAAFLTGRYPVRMGMAPTFFVRVNVYTSSTSGLPPSEFTFAQAAKEKGYSTAFMGKWHLGTSCATARDFCHHPLNFGFDYFFGLPLTNLRDFGTDGEKVIRGRNPWLELIFYSLSSGGIIFFFFLRKLEMIGTRSCLALSVLVVLPSVSFMALFYTFKHTSGLVMRNDELVEQPINLEGFTHRLVREGTDFLRRQDGEQPFLLVMSWLQVHTALHASSPFAGRSQHGKYGDEVEEMDWSVGQILKALDDRGLAEDTLVYFTSDNGGHVEEVGVHGNREGGHNGIYRGGKGQGGMDGGIRVPSLARWPGVIPPGTTVDTPTSLMDVFPTLLHVWDMPVPTDRVIDGVNILPLLTGQDTAPPHEFFVHYCGDQLHAARLVVGKGEDVYKAHFATPNWWPGTEGCGFICDCHGNMITWHDSPLLYNIARDPGERHLLDLTEPKHKAILEKIERLVAEHKRSVVPFESQFTWAKLLPRPWMQMCCNFPYCSCVDPKHVPRS